MGRKILVVGSSNTDMIIKCKSIPKPGETVLGGAFKMAAGGKGANQAVAAARAGGNVTFITKIGNDLFGQQAKDGFSSDNINTEYIMTDNEIPSGVALIFVDEKGENSIGVASGSNFKLSPSDINKLESVFSDFSIVLIQMEIPLETIRTVVNIAHMKGLTVILNPAPAHALDENLIKNIDILTPNETETESLTGIKLSNMNDIKKAAEILLGKGIRNIIVTLGKNGVLVKNSKIERFIPPFKVNVVDTTSAGDVFNGALAAALSENPDILSAVEFANAAAALSVTKFGAQPSIPYRKEIDEFIKK
jgi:ribokinase